MEDMKMMALNLGIIFALVIGIAAAAPEKREVGELLGTEAATGWTCRGQVHDCEATSLAGKLGCTDAEGKGADENTARADGLRVCAKKLRDTHEREVVCRDASQMRCEGR